MSGSICNGPSGALCIGCPNDNICQEPGVSFNSCCNNFANVRELSTAIVNSLGELPTEKSFSVVQFASDAQLVSGLAPFGETLSTIDQLIYSGGLADHSSAIATCQQSLYSSLYAPDRNRFIILVTDGNTGVPDYVPVGAAEASATSAKNEGTIIIPILIPPDSPDTNYQSIPFLIDLSSDGAIIDVTDYDLSKILQVQERLVEQVSVSCS